MSIILGIDPGLNTTGYGVVEYAAGQPPRLREGGVVRSKASGSLEQRLAEIHSGIAEVFAAFHPDTAALEELYSHYQRPKTAIVMGHARGVICLAAAQHNTPLEHYAATRIKKTLTGNGRASKTQMQHAIQTQFGLAKPPEPNDVADALAIALCHAFLHVQQADNLLRQATREPWESDSCSPKLQAG